MRRDNVDEKYKWDLSKMYVDKEHFERDFNEVKNELPQIEKYKEKFLETPDIFLEFMNVLENISRKVEKMYTYAHLAVDVEPENSDMQELSANIMGLVEELESKTVFIDLEILKNEDKARKVLEYVL